MQNVSDYKYIGKPEHVPEDINAEVFWGLFPQDTFMVQFCGMHKRNSYRDILEIEPEKEKLMLRLGRNSLYNSLPEYLFHSIDRFDHIPEREKKEKFAEEYSKQEQEKEQAYRFFYPIDTFLFLLRQQVRERFCKYAESNTLIQNIILDRFTAEQLENRFIKRTVPFVPSCKHIRGNRTLVTLLLRKILFEEGITVNIRRKEKVFTDEQPRYPDSVGSECGEMFAGNTYVDSVLSYTVTYWSDEDCDSKFLSFVDELEVYRQFVQDYFLAVDSILEFEILKDEDALIISDTAKYNYLNFNTNI